MALIDFVHKPLFLIRILDQKHIKVQNSYFAHLWTNESQNGHSGRASSPDGGDAAAGALAWRFEFGTPAIAAAEPASHR